MKRKWKITEAEKFKTGSGDTVRVFRVEHIGREWPVPHVWATDSYVRCVVCSSPLCGMSGCCVHALAVKRFLKRARREHGG